MDRQQWIDYARLHAEKLGKLIADYHPAARPIRPDSSLAEMESALSPNLPITAQGAEMSCEKVRRMIREKYKAGDKPDPVVDFAAAVASGNVAKINTLLNAAWFGVPESTSCWRIPGFKEAVDLIEDPPEPTEEEEKQYEEEE